MGDSAPAREIRFSGPHIMGPMTITYEWRGDFTSAEANGLHAECFDHPALSDDEWDWRGRSSGTASVVCARDGAGLVEVAGREARAAGREWLHVDFDDHLRAFHLDACRFAPTNAGLIGL
jgi:hypothetical protein